MEQQFRWCGSVLIVTLGVALAACSPSRAIEAYRVLDDVVSGAGPSALKSVTPVPRRETVAYNVAGRGRVADLYLPDEPSAAAVVLVPGAAPRGRDDPRLVAFANTLARARFQVLVPDVRNLRHLEVRADDAIEIADAVRYLTSPSSEGRAGEPHGTIGLFAISYAVGPAILAALEPDVRKHVGFIVGIGGYYDLEAVIAFFTTGYFRDPEDGAWRWAEPNAYGKWVFVRNNTRRLSDPRDREALAAMAHRKIAEPDAEIADLARSLGTEGRTVYALLQNEDPARVPELIADLPDPIRSEIRALSLRARDLSHLSAQMILIHGRDDVIIPYSESVALSVAAPRSEVYLVGQLAHVALDLSGLWDALKLWYATYRVLKLRDTRLGGSSSP